MIGWLRGIFRRITGISTPLGGISWNPSAPKASTVPTFLGPICITYPANQEFISFLRINDGRIVFLNTYLDASVSAQEHFETAEKGGIDLDLITSCAFSGVPLPLPNGEGSLVTLTFYFCSTHVLKYSSGGTGIVTVGINGFFEISRTFHGGPTLAFHLKEVDAPLELKIDFLNRQWR